MRGEILSFDEGSGIGLISGDDGIRYGFDRSAVQPPAAIRPGLRVDFVPENGEAVQVMLLAGAASASGSTGAPLGAGSATVGAFNWQTLLFAFDGRIRRSHFWIGWLILLGVGVVAGWIPILGGLISLALIWPNLAISVKRLHYMGQSGWLVAIPWVANIVGCIVGFSMIGMSAIANASALEREDPAAILALLGPAFGLLGLLLLLNLGFLLWIGVTEGQPGENRFGPNPKGL